MKFATILLIPCMINTCVSEFSSCWFCNQSNSVDPAEPLEFVDTYVPKQIIPVGTAGSLSCCSGNRLDTNTTWSKFDPETGSWLIIHEGRAPPRITGKMCDQGQTFYFDEVETIDNGTYICNASNGRSSITRNFTAVVSWCDSDPNFKVKIVRQPEPVIQVKMGTLFQQACVGDFGCLGAVTPNSSVVWSYLDGEGQIHTLQNGAVKRYFVTETISEDESKRSVVLSIENVTEGDGRIFVCRLTKDNYTVEFRISLAVQDSQTVIEKYKALIICLSVLALITGITGAASYRHCRYYLIYKWKVLLKSLPERGEKIYDVMLITSLEVQTDSEELKRITDKLKDRNYSVYHLPYGACNVQQIDDIARCVTIIFLLNPIQAEESDFLNRCVGACKFENVKPIFILTENLRNLAQVFGNEYEKVYETLPLFCKVLHWPSKNRKICLAEENFWSALWSELPDPESTHKERETSLRASEHLQPLFPQQ